PPLARAGHARVGAGQDKLAELKVTTQKRQEREPRREPFDGDEVVAAPTAHPHRIGIQGRTRKQNESQITVDGHIALGGRREALREDGAVLGPVDETGCYQQRANEDQDPRDSSSKDLYPARESKGDQ